MWMHANNSLKRQQYIKYECIKSTADFTTLIHSTVDCFEFVAPPFSADYDNDSK